MLNAAFGAMGAGMVLAWLETPGPAMAAFALAFVLVLVDTLRPGK